MGLFDDIIDSTFDQRDQGDSVFYPYGPVGRGYVITRGIEEKLRKFLRNYYWLVLVAAIFAGTVLPRFGWRGALGLMVLMFLMLVGYEIRVRQLVRGATRASSVRAKRDSAQLSGGPDPRN